jgi:arsenite-transporting ATPase
MRWKYRYVLTTLRGAYKPDEGDAFLVEMKKTVAGIRSLFKDAERCEFIGVTIPEDMAVREAERMIVELNKYGMTIKQLVVNNVVPLNDRCEFCTEKRKGEEHYINYLREQMGTTRITLVPLRPREVRGIDALNNFKELLFQ